MSNSQDDAVSPTGAVRNKLALAPSLISPCGMTRMARLYRSGAVDALIDECDPWYDFVGRALGLTLRYLGGGPLRDLEMATACVFEATAALVGESRMPQAEVGSNSGFDLIPVSAWRGLAATYKEGADKRGAMNWEKGMTVLECLDHGMAHLIERLGDDESQPHMAHACWNYVGAIHSHIMWPKINRPHRRKGGLAPGADAGTLTDRAAGVTWTDLGSGRWRIEQAVEASRPERIELAENGRRLHPWSDLFGGPAARGTRPGGRYTDRDPAA